LIKVKEKVKLNMNIWAVLENIETGEKRIIKGKNIVTNDGDAYYAQMAAGEAPSDDFDAAASGLRLGSGTATPAKTDTDVQTYINTSLKGLDTGYEKTNDNDTDNTGAAVDSVTWRYSYIAADGPYANIYEGAIVDNRTTPTAALTHFQFAATFSKTTSDTLKVFVNHNMLGV